MIALDHIAIAMERLADAPSVLVGDLGGRPAYGSSSGLYNFGQWRFAGGGRLEVLEPRGRDGFLRRFLAEHGPGIHHVTFKVPSLTEACARAEAHGHSIVGYDDSDPEWKEAFLHPKRALGIVVQLAESSQAGEDILAGWQPPPGPQNPPPAVRLLGLRMRAESEHRARAQWEVVLEGSCERQSPSELVFQWPHSPLRIIVEISAAGDEGAIALELESERRLSLPDGPHPVLGVFLVQRFRTG
jgi:glyoxalase/bleomycin resistance protein/dioxygenase superfamily protein